MDFGEAIQKLSASVPEPVGETYLGKDGLLRCKKCGGRRETIITLFEEERKVRCICTCQKEALEAEEERRRNKECVRKIERIRASGFQDQQLTEWTFHNDDGSQPVAMTAARNYVANFKKFKEDGRGLLLYGGVGTGKTYIAAAIANALIDEAIPALVTNFARIAYKLQESFAGRQAYLDNLNRFDLLVIDDLAAERRTEYMQEIVFNVIDARYRSGLPMVITTNLSLGALRKPETAAESRVYDRILEKCFPLEVAGQSHRKKALKRNYDEMKEILGV